MKDIEIIINQQGIRCVNVTFDDFQDQLQATEFLDKMQEAFAALDRAAKEVELTESVRIADDLVVAVANQSVVDFLQDGQFRSLGAVPQGEQTV